MEQGEPGSGEHTHELLEWLEWLAEIKFNVHMLDVDEICSEGGKMVRVIPLPRRSLMFCKNNLMTDE